MDKNSEKSDSGIFQIISHWSTSTFPKHNLEKVLRKGKREKFRHKGSSINYVTAIEGGVKDFQMTVKNIILELKLKVAMMGRGVIKKMFDGHDVIYGRPLSLSSLIFRIWKFEWKFCTPLYFKVISN